MTIYLPEGVGLFRQAFDETCDRILGTEKDPAFYALSVELIQGLRGHPLLKEYLHWLEVDSAKRKQESSIAELEALEDSWLKLWKYHCHSLKHRKQLVRIKRMVTAPNAIESSPLYSRILFSMAEFRYHSPFFRFMNEAPRLFRTAQSESHLASIRLDCSYPSREGYFAKRKIALSKLRRGDKRRGLHSKIFDPGLPENTSPLKRSAECVYAALFSPKVDEIERKSAKFGRNEYEKRQNIQILAETSAFFCWERLCFLEKYFLSNGAFPVLSSFKGRWAKVREPAWKSSKERSEIETILWGRLLPGQSPSIEHQIHRKDIEKYLGSLKAHIHAQLFKIESMRHKAEENPLLDLPGTQKEDFVIDLAPRFWKENPLGNRDSAFSHYCAKCPFPKLLKRDRWEQIVRERHLDPRPKESKKRGPGKKTCKN